MFLCFKTTK